MRDLRQIWQGAGFERPGVLMLSFKTCCYLDNGFDPAMDDLSMKLQLVRQNKQTKFVPNFLQQYDVFICILLTMIFEAFIRKEVLHLKTVD